MSQPYTDAKKLEVVTTYLALGKVPMVEAVTGVNRHTIRQWKMQPWWVEMVDQIQTDSDQELDAKLAKIIDRSLDAVNDRIENGDFIFDPKSGSIKRSPVKLRDVHRVSVDLIDKRDLIRKRPQEKIEQSATVDILRKLATQFAEWAKIHVKEPRVIEGETIAISEPTTAPIHVQPEASNGQEVGETHPEEQTAA